jgi:uncharacterized membrane protein YgcG
MGSSRIPRLAAAFAAVVLFGLASPAQASMTISINPGNLTGMPAGQWGTQECSTALGGGSYADRDVWVFNLAGNHETTGDFLSLTLSFQTPGGDAVRAIPGPDSGIVLLGHSKAWIAVPAGWVLKAASAVISGTADQFVLTHTCPAGGTNGGGDGGNSGGGDGGGGDGGNSGGGGGDNNGDGGPLPTTGAPVTGIILAGSLIAGTGAALVYFVQRRRRIDLGAETEETS